MALTQVKTLGIAADAITNAKVADNSVNTENLYDNAVEQDQIADNAIGGSQVINGAIDTNELADNAVTLAKMASGTDGQIITYDASGNPVAVGPGTDGQVLTSTGAGSPPAFESPAAGVGGASGVDFNDSVKVRLGADNDLQLYHNGSESIIAHIPTSGALRIAGDGLKLMSNAGDENYLVANHNGAVELYHNDIKKAETVSGGLAVYGTEGAEGELYIYADEADDNADKWRLKADHVASGFYIQNYNSGSWEDSLKCFGDGATELYHNNSKKLETTSTGINITGGIRLGGNNAVNELDDYEEGSFTPSLTYTTPSNIALPEQVGQYRKIGSFVYCNILVSNTKNSASGDLIVTGLPFASHGTGSHSRIYADIYYSSGWNHVHMRPWFYQGTHSQTSIHCYQGNDENNWTGNQDAVTANDCDDLTLRIGCWYYTA